MTKNIRPLSLLLLAILTIHYGCRELFEPEIISFDHSILVVEGYIEVGGGKTSIKLGRTKPIYDPISFFPVEFAMVTIEGEDGGVWSLSDEGNGVYISTDYLPENQDYQLNILTPQNEHYSSKMITPIITPEISEITFEKLDGDVSIYANTFGNEEANYFIWEYKEDWAFRSRYLSSYRFNAGTKSMALLKPEELTFNCWQADHSKRIILASSQGYQNQYIHQKELLKIDSLSEKLSLRYSILVKQKAIDQEAFAFWEAVRKNSDDIGGIFSPLPSSIGGNLSNLDHPDEPVIGYISAGKSSERRIYIDRRDVIPWRVVVPDYEKCEMTVVIPDDYYDYFVTLNFVPLYENCEFPCREFLAAPVNCTDCSLRGSLEMPEFWEE